METLFIYLAKIKYFIVGFFAGILLKHFEYQISNVKFNLGKFIISGVVFGLLTIFGQWVITGFFFDDITAVKEEKILVLSLLTALLLQFIIPFIYRNPEQFVKFVLSRFGIKLSDDNSKK